MLKKELVGQITDFVRQRPRTIQEIAHLLQKNWRTADRYVDQIATESGQIAVRTFRGGTRGALKVVYARLGQRMGSAYQERLLQKILHGRLKEEFSPFDIYQFVPEEYREAFVETDEHSEHPKVNFAQLLKRAKSQLLLFSGNMSWVDRGDDMLNILEDLIKKKVRIKILTKIDLTSIRNVKRVLALNERVGHDSIEIRHAEHPLRAMVCDDSFISIKEVLSPQYAKSRELKDTTFIFYHIEDQEWINWMQKTFWHIFQHSINADQRLSALSTLNKSFT